MGFEFILYAAAPASLQRLLRRAVMDLSDDEIDDAQAVGGALAVLRKVRHDPTLSAKYIGTLERVGDAWPTGPWVVVSTSAHVSIDAGPPADTELAAIIAAFPEEAP